MRFDLRSLATSSLGTGTEWTVVLPDGSRLIREDRDRAYYSACHAAIRAKGGTIKADEERRTFTVRATGISPTESG